MYSLKDDIKVKRRLLLDKRKGLREKGRGIREADREMDMTKYMYV